MTVPLPPLERRLEVCAAIASAIRANGGDVVKVCREIRAAKRARQWRARCKLFLRHAPRQLEATL